MIVKQLIIKPFEAIAGMEFPDTQAIRREASAEHATPSEVEMSVVYARREFKESLLSLQGLRRMIG